MGLNRGGLLASAAFGALGFTDPSICSIDDGAGGGGGGGAADLLEDDAGAGGGDDAAAAAAAAAAGGDDAAAAAAAAAGDALNFDWAAGVSTDAGDKDSSNLDRLKGTKVKDLDSLVTIARDNQRALRESGRVKIPGADAKPEEIKAYREAIGVPETVDGYEIKLPEGLDPEKYEVDGKFLNPLREVALANNVPAAAFGKFAEAFMALQAEQISQEGAANNQARDAKLKEWGANSPTKREEFKRGAEALGLDKNAINRIQAGFGVGETMELLARIGHMAGEDFFANGKAAERFGVSDLASAQAALDKMISDPETAKTLRNKSDPALIAKYNRLTEAVGHYKSLEARS